MTVGVPDTSVLTTATRRIGPTLEISPRPTQPQLTLAQRWSADRDRKIAMTNTSAIRLNAQNVGSVLEIEGEAGMRRMAPKTTKNVRESLSILNSRSDLRATTSMAAVVA
jgi:hypothetical protein